MTRLFSLLLLALCIGPVHAQPAAGSSGPGYPAKSLRLIVPWPAGGDTDIVARVVGQKLSEALGQPVVIENRAGGSGSVGTETMVRSPADGHTLLVSSMGTHTMNQFLARLDHDPVADVAPVSRLVNIPSALVAHSSMPFNDAKGFIAAAKANPGKLNVGSGSNAYKLFLEMLKARAEIDVEHIRYRGAGPAVNDLLGRQVEMLIVGLPAIAPHVRAGKLKVIALTNTQRAPAMPELPTFSETLPGLEFNNWTAMFVAAGTPRPIVDRLNSEVVRILGLPDVRERLAGLGAIPSPNTPDEMAAILKSDADRYGRIIKASGMQGD